MAITSTEVSMPHRTASFVEIWEYITANMDRIMAHPEQISGETATRLYTVIYNIITSESSALGIRKSAVHELYDNVAEYFMVRVKNLLQQTEFLSDFDLLQYYTVTWENYWMGVKVIDRRFAFMNRYWVPAMRGSGRKDILPVYKLSLVQWNKYFFLPIQENHSRLSTTIIDLIGQEQNGKEIDQSLIKKAVDAFVSLDLNTDDLKADDPAKEDFDLYKKHIEPGLISTTVAYYRKKSATFLAKNSVADYLEKMEEILQEEDLRAELYLPSTRRHEFMANYDEVLIWEHLDLMLDAFRDFLDFDQQQHLRRLHTFLSRIPGGLDQLKKKFEAHVANALVSASAPIGIATAYMNVFLPIYKKYSEIIATAFMGDGEFLACLDKAFRGVINGKAVTACSSMILAAVLATHLDTLLRRNNKKPKEDTEAIVKQIITFFGFLNDKDIFQRLHAINLSKRLRHDDSALEDREAAIIDKLEQAGCRVPYTRHLRQILAGKLQLEASSSCHRCLCKCAIDVNDVNFLRSIVADDRNHIFQTTILRIMKTRKVLKGQALIQEVRSQICQHESFVPELADILKVIESLQVKQSIERMEGANIDIFVHGAVDL